MTTVKDHWPSLLALAVCGMELFSTDMIYLFVAMLSCTAIIIDCVKS